MFKLRFTYLAIALGLASSAACNKDKTRDNAENAAENVREKTGDLQDEAKDLAETAKDKSKDMTDEVKNTAEDIKDESTDMTKSGIEARDSQKEFEYQRLVRVQTLRAVHSITASQPPVINVMASSMPLVDADRAKINEKVQLVQMRLDESANLIQSLETVDANNWEPRERDVASAMNRLEDARKDAWEALDEAQHPDTSMR